MQQQDRAVDADFCFCFRVQAHIFLPLTSHPLEVESFKSNYVVWGSVASSTSGIYGRNPADRIWCISALESDICWQQF